MYDRTKARERGLIVECNGDWLCEPVTISGTYRCTEGHAHLVQWHGRTFRVSIGYDPLFLGAIERADWEGLCAGDPETIAYETAYNAVLCREGYSNVVS